jgi:lipid-binding SYLF domain-containing protein
MTRHTATGLRAFLGALAMSFFLLPLGAAHAKDDAAKIDAGVDAALQKFKQDVKGADEYLASAKGVLVMPDVKKIGLVVGAQWGKGALRVDGKTVDYYKMEAGSAGTLKSKSSIVAFAFGKEGLMGGWSAKGTKVTKLKFD